MSESPIPIARPLLGQPELSALARPIGSGWVGQGPEVAAFEAELAAALAVDGAAPQVAAVANGTAALQLALLALEIGPGDEVVTVSSSFVATANAVRLVGARPVFVDVERASGNLDPERLQAAVGERTRAVIAPHQLGLPCDLARLLPGCQRLGLPLIEDAACALGSQIELGGRWQPIGAPHGQLATFSFHPRKLITTGEGGAVVTRDPALDARVRSLRAHGADADAFATVGFNYRLSDLQAAVGRAQLVRLPAMVAERRALAARYDAALAPLAEAGRLRLPTEPAWARGNIQSYRLRVPDPAQLAACQAALDADNISWRGGLPCIHREPAYADHPDSWRAADPLEESVAHELQGLMLPLYCGLSEADQRRVIRAVRASLG